MNRVLTTGSPAPTLRSYETSPRRFSAIGALAARLFAELRRRIDTLVALRTRAEYAMLDLKEEYNRSVPPTRLRLRPWSRSKGMPPYAIYWIFVNRRRRLVESVVDRAIERLKPRRFVRFKVAARRRLRWGIYWGGLTAYRAVVLAFDRRAAELNEAHRLAARALDSLRKMLDSRAGGKETVISIPLLPRDCYPDRCPTELHRLYFLHWRFVHVLSAIGEQSRALADKSRHEHLPGGLRLRYRRDADHPFGQLLWSAASGRVAFSKLSERMLRMLRLRSADRRIIARVERERRRHIHRLGCLTSMLRKLRTKGLATIRKVERILDQPIKAPMGLQAPSEFDQDPRPKRPPTMSSDERVCTKEALCRSRP